MPIISAICSVVRSSQVAPEPELGSRGDAVDRLRAALAEVDLVEVGLEDRALVVARLDQQRVQDLVELAGERLLLADAEQAAARELLGQRAGALLGLARLHVDEGRAQHAAEVDAVVVGEVAVLDRLQAGDQQLAARPRRAPGGVPPASGRTSVAMRAASSLADLIVRLPSVGRRDPARATRVRRTASTSMRLRADRAVDVLETAAGDDPAAAVARVGAGARAVAVSR